MDVDNNNMSSDWSANESIHDTPARKSWKESNPWDSPTRVSVKRSKRPQQQKRKLEITVTEPDEPHAVLSSPVERLQNDNDHRLRPRESSSAHAMAVEYDLDRLDVEIGKRRSSVVYREMALARKQKDIMQMEIELNKEEQELEELQSLTRNYRNSIDSIDKNVQQQLHAMQIGRFFVEGAQ